MSATEQVNQVCTFHSLLWFILAWSAAFWFVFRVFAQILALWAILKASDSPYSSTGHDQSILACKVALICWKSVLSVFGPMGSCACMNAGEGDCQHISMLCSAYRVARRDVYHQLVHMASRYGLQWGLGCTAPAFANGNARRDANPGHWRYDLLCHVSYCFPLPLSSFNEHQDLFFSLFAIIILVFPLQLPFVNA